MYKILIVTVDYGLDVTDVLAEYCTQHRYITCDVKEKVEVKVILTSLVDWLIKRTLNSKGI